MPVIGRGTWTIRRDSIVVARDGTFRLAKQTMRRLRRADPAATWTVVDPTGRVVIGERGTDAR